MAGGKGRENCILVEGNRVLGGRRGGGDGQEGRREAAAWAEDRIGEPTGPRSEFARWQCGQA